MRQSILDLRRATELGAGGDALAPLAYICAH